MAITFEQAKQLKYRDVIHFHSNGKCHNYRVNGKVQLWKTRPDEIRVPVKYGLKGYGELNHTNLDKVHLASECPIQNAIDYGQLMKLSDAAELGMTKDELAKVYGLKKYDTAIPQSLFDQLSKEGFDPYFQFVYSYDRHKTFGELFPLTIEAETRMRELGMFIPPIPLCDID